MFKIKWLLGVVAIHEHVSHGRGVLGGASISRAAANRYWSWMLLTFPSPGCRWGPPRSCSCTSWRAPSRPSSQAGHQRDQTHQTATSGSAGLRGWLGNTIGARGACRGSLQLLWGAATLYRPRSSSKTHFKIVDSSRLNASRVVVLLRGRWLHWAPGGRSRRRRRRGASSSSV